jgi:hypothetical protein
MNHSFDIDLAAKYGIPEAILIHHFQHWIRVNKTLRQNEIDGKTWTYQTIDEIAAHFPYFTKNEVVELIEKLCTGKGRRAKNKSFEPVLVKGFHNRNKFDRRTWYAFKNEEMFTILACAKMEDGLSQNASWLEPKSKVAQAKMEDGLSQDVVYTNTKPDTKPDTKQVIEGSLPRSIERHVVVEAKPATAPPKGRRPRKDFYSALSDSEREVCSAVEETAEKTGHSITRETLTYWISQLPTGGASRVLEVLQLFKERLKKGHQIESMGAFMRDALNKGLKPETDESLENKLYAEKLCQKTRYIRPLQRYVSLPGGKELYYNNPSFREHLDYMVELYVRLEE